MSEDTRADTSRPKLSVQVREKVGQPIHRTARRRQRQVGLAFAEADHVKVTDTRHTPGRVVLKRE